MTRPSAVMPALVAGIHAFLAGLSASEGVDGRDKPGHDSGEATEHDRNYCNFRLIKTSGGTMHKSTFLVGLFGVGLLVATTTQAHHAVQAQFDVNKQESFVGVLTKVDWINPHAWFHFDVKKEDGTVEQWETESIGPIGLRRLGFSNTPLFRHCLTSHFYTSTHLPGSHISIT